MPNAPRAADRWPALPYQAWAETSVTLHMWTQMVGKVRLRHTPWLNHSWHATFYVTPRGLSTSTICIGERSLAAEFDFIDHQLRIQTSDGEQQELPLRPQTTADFHAGLRSALRELGLPDEFHGKPNEVETATPFAEDIEHCSYDGAAAQRFWHVLLQVDRVFKTFRARFLGKCSPVHLFWGSFDLAVTRFSGRTAPEHRGGFPNLPDAVTREAYSHEVSSAGFWPGGPQAPEPIFFSYAYPTPDGFKDQPVQPAAASWHDGLGEFVLPYEAVRTAASPEQALLDFLESTYAAAAKTADWDRDALERTFRR